MYLLSHPTTSMIMIITRTSTVSTIAQPNSSMLLYPQRSTAHNVTIDGAQPSCIQFVGSCQPLRILQFIEAHPDKRTNRRHPYAHRKSASANVCVNPDKLFQLASVRRYAPECQSVSPGPGVLFGVCRRAQSSIGGSSDCPRHS